MLGSIRRRVAIGALTSLAAAMFTVIPATASMAATSSPDHRDGAASSAAAVLPASDSADCRAYVTDLCWWVDANEVGKMHPVRDAISSWATQKEPTCTTGDSDGTWNDCASTLYNPTSNGAVVYSDTNFEGYSICLDPGQYVANLAQVGWPDSQGTSMNDSISSNSWVPGGC
jgi:hypothetical protein